MAGRRPHARRFALLALTDQSDEAAKALILEHRSLGDTPQLVERPVGQRRPEVGVARLDQLESLNLDAGRHPPVAGSAALLGDEGRRAMLLVGLRQPKNLAALQAHELAGRQNRQPSGGEIAEDLDSAKLLVAHDM